MLKVSHLRKAYESVVAVDDVSLEVQRGELFGLLGPNGAGKTTTIRTVLNVIAPDSGTISFDGKPFTPEMWNVIGYLPEERGLYRKSKIINTILYFASLKGLDEHEAKPLAYQWLDRFGLKESAHRKVEELSKGNQQKVQLIISVLHRPQLLILDEPFSGLDPVNQIMLKDVLMELRQQNVAIVFSTHQMEQVEKMCDNIFLINRGREVLSGSLRDVKKRYGTNSLRIEYEGDGEFLKTMSNVKRADVYQNYAELELVDAAHSSKVLSKLDAKLSIQKFEIVEPSLNSIFINVVGPPPEMQDLVTPPVTPKKREKKPAAPEVRKQFRSVILTTVVFVAITISTVFVDDPQWFIPLIFLAAVGFSVFRYLKVKRDVEDAERKKEVGGSR